ncbi:MAG: hypothetical protein ABIW82_13155 [Dokdonella sp.]
MDHRLRRDEGQLRREVQRVYVDRARVKGCACAGLPQGSEQAFAGIESTSGDDQAQVFAARQRGAIRAPNWP